LGARPGEAQISESAGRRLKPGG